MAIDDSRPARAAVAMLDIPVEDLWTDYLAFGGAQPLPQLMDFLAGRSVLSDSDYDRLAHALNERFMDRDQNHPLPYAEDMDPAEDP